MESPASGGLVGLPVRVRLLARCAQASTQTGGRKAYAGAPVIAERQRAVGDVLTVGVKPALKCTWSST